jgi:NAD-dependent DNA ligase
MSTTGQNVSLEQLSAWAQRSRMVESPYGYGRYEIIRRLGRGGFGVACLANMVGVDAKVCVKLTLDQQSWHQEAYFGSLLEGHTRVTQLRESFPFQIRIRRRIVPAFASVFEYAENGDLEHFLKDKGKWTEARVRREGIALVKLLTQLHSSGFLHRDISLGNILVGAKGSLKLADFGIARQEFDGKGVRADDFNPRFVSDQKFFVGRLHWRTSDDVYQVGQILTAMLTGDTEELFRWNHIRALDVSQDLKEILQKATGARNNRYESAYEMLLALEGNDVEKPSVRTLSRKRVVFTGPLLIKREDAELMVTQAGGTVQRVVRQNTDVVVVGQRSKNYASKLRGRKLELAQALIKKGAKIRFINEPQFMRLGGRP